jgi:hypothetical protein
VPAPYDAGSGVMGRSQLALPAVRCCLVSLCRLPAFSSANGSNARRSNRPSRAFNTLPVWRRLAARRAPPQRHWWPYLGPACPCPYICFAALSASRFPTTLYPLAACPDVLADAIRKPQICCAACNNRSVPRHWPAHGPRRSSVSGFRFRIRISSIAPDEPSL